MSIYICTICEQQKDGDFNCAELDGKECCEECFENNNNDEGAYERYLESYYGGDGPDLTLDINKTQRVIYKLLTQ